MVVVLIREERMASRFDSVHTPLKTATPPRLTTVSTPAKAAGSTWPASGSQRNSVAVAGSRRTSRTTV